MPPGKHTMPPVVHQGGYTRQPVLPGLHNGRGGKKKTYRSNRVACHRNVVVPHVR